MSLLDFLAGPNENIPADQVEPLSYPVDETGGMITQPEADAAYQSEEPAPEGIAMPQPGTASEPLYVVNEAGDFGFAGQVPVSSIPTRVISLDRNRQAVVITNTSNANVMYIAFTQGNASVGSMTAYPLNPLTSLTLNYDGEIWASSAAANVCGFISVSKRG